MIQEVSTEKFFYDYMKITIDQNLCDSAKEVLLRTCLPLYACIRKEQSFQINTIKLQLLNKNEIDNLNSLISTKEIEFFI